MAYNDWHHVNCWNKRVAGERPGFSVVSGTLGMCLDTIIREHATYVEVLFTDGRVGWVYVNDLKVV